MHMYIFVNRSVSKASCVPPPFLTKRRESFLLGHFRLFAAKSRRAAAFGTFVLDHMFCWSPLSVPGSRYRSLQECSARG